MQSMGHGSGRFGDAVVMDDRLKGVGGAEDGGVAHGCCGGVLDSGRWDRRRATPSGLETAAVKRDSGLLDLMRRLWLGSCI